MNLKHKYRNLTLSILFDLIGLIPFIDFIWAPISAYLMIRLYKGDSGKIAGVFAFIEEIIPGTDFIPSFTIMWIYTYVFKRVDNNSIVEV
ncbi:hypothetical protein RM697_02475 [Ichthyenterobacterium sp. W332]|uniref:Uncharacterized protein n=1 Tax=Microcosmobacter mediterraneus TaxID=3075607 RepID=A0ABU2YH52_9FLAO|nr:hypothetical protein [Ichthyenterobacterium sp. W332]MDT0557496.1 hypothetical protein [Ichthyenterobacterium sp. W332]